MNDEDEYPRRMAEEHWEYVESVCHKMYVDAFIHGWKHGCNDIMNPPYIKMKDKLHQK